MSNARYCDRNCPACTAVFHADDVAALEQLWRDVKAAGIRLGLPEPQQNPSRDHHFGCVIKMAMMEWADVFTERVLVIEDDSDDADWEEGSSEAETESEVESDEMELL